VSAEASAFDDPDDGRVQAAGGVVWRSAADGRPEVLVVHRVAHDDWCWPKGKAESYDASPEHTARREVFEETGLSCELGAPLGSVSYVARGRPKIVRYWMMQPLDGVFAPNKEVDQIEWLIPEQARDRLVYALDREILDRFLQELDRTS
jgi:8-oxo-dGTP diphosphatase